MVNSEIKDAQSVPQGELVLYQGQNNEFTVEVRTEGDTVWLTQQQMAALYDTSRTNIVEHIQHIYAEKELEMDATCRIFRQVQNEGKRMVSREMLFYNLDMIISIGYRVNSKRATHFRRWATTVLKHHLIQGYSVNLNRLSQLNKVVEILSRSATPEIAGISFVLSAFTTGLQLLDSYDQQNLTKPSGSASDWVLTYESARAFVDSMCFGQESDLFGREKDDSFQATLGAIYQTFDGQEVYPSVEEKAANLLYLTVKNHSFIDGNKRIAAALFVYFLDGNKALKNASGRLRVTNETLAAMTLMIALSHPEEKATMCLLVMNMLVDRGE